MVNAKGSISAASFGASRAPLVGEMMFPADVLPEQLHDWYEGMLMNTLAFRKPSTCNVLNRHLQFPSV